MSYMFADKQGGQNDCQEENWGKRQKEIRIDRCWGPVLQRTSDQYVYFGLYSE